MKEGRLLGCVSPSGLFPGEPKYGCFGNFSTPEACDAAAYPVKDTEYVRAVHEGCDCVRGRGAFSYAFDKGVSLRQCSPLTRYEWVLCPNGSETITWAAEVAPDNSTRRFRVSNRCSQPVWIQQAAPPVAEGELAIWQVQPGEWHTFAIPLRGLPATRFLPKTGCDESGNACDVQSMPPCPPTGCDLPMDTKFEASWGCLHARGAAEDEELCALTPQGNPSTYQDWWDIRAVDGWTLPFTVLVDDGGYGLAPGLNSSSLCCAVVCDKLDVAKLCPSAEFLTPMA